MLSPVFPPLCKGTHEKKHAAYGLNLWYRFEVPVRIDEEKSAHGLRVLAVAEALRSHNLLAAFLEHVESDALHTPSYLSNDPRRWEQTHFDTIGLAEAWEMTAGDPRVVIQVVDSGVEEDHPDLRHTLFRHPGESSCSDGIDNDGNGYVDDCKGWNHADESNSLMGDGSHGMHCAGTVAAENDNTVGVAGVAGGKGGQRGVSLMISTVFGTTSTNGFAEAIVYGADNGAHVSSNSWGYSEPGVFDSSVLDAIDYAHDNGVLVVFAAGNDGSNNEWYPAAHSSCIAVAATDDAGVVAPFSNTGDWVDILGPGFPVLSTVSVSEGSYGWHSGTSMAAPHIAGILGLGKSYKFSATPENLRSCLLSTATTVDSLNPAALGKFGAGLASAPGFLNCLGPPPSHSPTVSLGPTQTPGPTKSPSSCHCTGTLELAVTTDDFPGENSWTLSALPSAASQNCGQQRFFGGPRVKWAKSTTLRDTIATGLCDWTEYTFTFEDIYGDGICCSHGVGGFSLYLDGLLVHESKGSFGASDAISFTPGVVATLQPSGAPTEAPSLAPTFVPSRTKHPPQPTPYFRAKSSSSCQSLGWSTGNSSVCLKQLRCGKEKTFAQVERKCKKIGARMCTRQEVWRGEGGTCAESDKWVWTSTSCGTPQKFILAKTPGPLGGKKGGTRCKKSFKSAGMVCCADTFDQDSQ